jgi:hypothetical protein
MKYSIVVISVLIAATSCAQVRPPETPDLSALSGEWRDPAEAGAALDGLSVDGHVRARGLAGLFSAPGTLSFRDGLLVWTARGTRDAGAYRVRPVPGGLAFRAEHALANGERAVWAGRHDGTRLHNVSAVWYRVEGDWIHDLFLPDAVTLDFTPATTAASDQ